MKNVIVVGGGAAGMIAAIAAAQNGAHVTLLEKNEKLGKKIYITGKGRCNVTNACEAEDFFSNVVSNSKFMYSAFYSYDNNMVYDLIESTGCKLKVERGNRVFPLSDHSSDIINSFNKLLKQNKVDVHLNTAVSGLFIKDNRCAGVVLTNKTIECDAVIVATGGLSYQSTGSTGDGINWARKSEHKIVECSPALVPLVAKEEWVKDLQGLSLKNVSVTLINANKKLYSGFGEMLFTHFGVSGPLILSASTKVKEEIYTQEPKLYIDLKPAMSEKELDDRILKDFKLYSNRQFINSLSDLLPSKMIPVIVRLSGIDERKQVNLITKEERLKLVGLLKKLELTVIGNRGFNEAIITRGGISVKEINPSTMESKKYKGLYFAGEMIDVDALTGGFNLQIAWSTGYLAAQHYE